MATPTIAWARPPYHKRDVIAGYDRGWWQTELGNIERSILPSSVNLVHGNYTPTARDRTVLINTTAGAVTITLPSPQPLKGLELTIKHVTGSPTVTITGPVDGAASVVLNQPFEFLQVISDGTQWLKIGGN